MSENKKIVTQLITGFLGAMLGLVGVIAFNQYLLMGLPVGARMGLMIVTYWIIALIPFLVMLSARDNLTDYGFAREKIGAQVLVGILLGVIMSLVFTLLPTLLGMGDWVDNGHHYQYAWQFAFEFLYCIVAVSLVEEFVFRGFIFAKIKRISGSVKTAIILSSVLFGLFHLFGGSIIQVIVTGVLGAFFCLCREKIKNCTLLSLILAHGIYDALITVWASVL